MRDNSLHTKVMVLAILCLFIGIGVVPVLNVQSLSNSDTKISVGAALSDGYFCGCIPVSNTITPDEISEIIGNSPSSWDWRNVQYEGFVGDWTTSVKSQGNCGSCWDFAAMGALEAIINIREGFPDLDPNLSEQYLLSCPTNSGGCSGWDAYYAYGYLESSGGAIPESCFPYRADDFIPCSDKCENWKDQLIPISGFGYWSKPNINFIKSKLIEKGPLCACMAVYNDFGSYTGGIYEHPGYEYPSNINHQVVLVGYNDDPGYWICKNSWGKHWGEDGWFKIAYGDCQIEYEIVYVDFDENLVNWPPLADAGGPYFGKVGEIINFDGSDSFDTDNNTISYEWDFDDGGNGIGISPTHSYSEEGRYTVKLTVTDEEGEYDFDETTVYIDETSPTVDINQPFQGYLYIYGNRIMSLPFKTRVIGEIEIRVSADDPLSGVNKVEFYIDDKLSATDTNSPYYWKWEEPAYFTHTIKLIAYDNAGNNAVKEMKVWKFF